MVIRSVTFAEHGVWEWKKWIEWDYYTVTLGKNRRFGIMNLESPGVVDTTPPALGELEFTQLNTTHAKVVFAGFVEEESNILDIE